jgi:uncharacterized protein
MTSTKAEHLDRTLTPKRILSLDGGGMRGVLSLEYLEAIETLLRARSGRVDFRLCDYFDLIGGTSTGAILAAALACGSSVAELKQLYNELGTDIFDRSPLRKGFLASKFRTEPIERALRARFGNVTLDSDTVRTGLMVMTKRLDTGSPWPLHNHPDAVYSKQDGRLVLAEIVRASTAAPTYFQPELIDISSGDGRVVQGAFVDGGVSPFNDPSLQLMMIAALNGHGFRWQVGADHLLLVSIGTGTRIERYSARDVTGWLPVEQGLRALQSLMDDCASVNHGIMQWLTQCMTPWNIDSIVGDMSADSVAGPKLARYARYNAVLDQGWLRSMLGLDYTPEQLEHIARMDDPSNVRALAEIGRRAASAQVNDDHFPRAFDVR